MIKRPDLMLDLFGIECRVFHQSSSLVRRSVLHKVYRVFCKVNRVFYAKLDPTPRTYADSITLHIHNLSN